MGCNYSTGCFVVDRKLELGGFVLEIIIVLFVCLALCSTVAIVESIKILKYIGVNILNIIFILCVWVALITINTAIFIMIIQAIRRGW